MVKLNKDSLRTLSERQDWPHWTSVPFWTIGALVMFGLTVKDLRPLLIDYCDVEENTQVQIIMKQGDEDFDRPEIYLSIPLLEYGAFSNFSEALRDHLRLNLSCDQCDVMASNSFDVWNRRNSSVLLNEANSTEFDRSLIAAFAQRLLELDPSDRASIINADNLDWNRPILYALVSLLSNETEAENNFLQNVTVDQSVTTFDPVVPISEHQTYALYSTMAAFMCQMMLVRVDKNASEGEDKAVSHDRCVAILLNDSQVVMPLSNNDPYIHFRFVLPLDGADFVQVWLNSTYFDDCVRKRFVRIQVLDKASKQFYGLEQFKETTDLELGEIRNEDLLVFYSIRTSLVEARPSKMRTCFSRETSVVDCIAKCRMRLLESICHCSLYQMDDKYKRTVNDSSNNTSKGYCNRIDYDRCSEQFRQATLDCPNQCKDPCHSMSYDYRVIRNVGRNKNRSSFGIILIPTKQPYLEFVMKVKDSTESLISQVGGVFNFYLGISGLSIVCLFIYALDGCRRWRRSTRSDAKEARASKRRQKPLGDWMVRWRWLSMMVGTASSDASMGNEGDTRNQRSGEVEEKMMLRFDTVQKQLEDKMDEMAKRMDEKMEKLEKTMRKLVEVKCEQTAESVYVN